MAGCLLDAIASIHAEWSYQEPTKVWGQKYPDCNGHRQSPIDLEFIEKKYIDHIALELDPSYSEIHHFKITNNGHTLQASTADEEGPRPTLRFANEEFRFEQFHFHWGENDNYGSEHAIGGHKFPVEVKPIKARL